MKKDLILAAALSLFMTISAHAEIIKLDPITVAESGAWAGELKAQPAALDRIWCRDLSDIPRTSVCISQSAESVNQTLSRASAFIEGLSGGEAGIIHSWDDKRAKITMLWGIAGHDLRSSDMQRFYDALEAKCVDDVTLCITEPETAMKTYSQSKTKELGGDTTLIALGLDDRSYLATLSHELIHAQFFQSPAFHDLIRGFWEAHSADDSWLQYVVKDLGRDYDQKNTELMMNEMAAYVLEEPNYSEYLTERKKEFSAEIHKRAESLGVKILKPQTTATH